MKSHLQMKSINLNQREENKNNKNNQEKRVYRIGSKGENLHVYIMRNLIRTINETQDLIKIPRKIIKRDRNKKKLQTLIRINFWKILKNMKS